MCRASKSVWGVTGKPGRKSASTRGADVLVALLGTVFGGILCNDRWSI